MSAAGSELGPWVPTTPPAVAELFAEAGFPWWIAGGYAIELAVGRPLREHGDLDVLVLRRDQTRVRELLASWDLHLADPPGAGTLRRWNPTEGVPSLVHDVWCRCAPEAPWSLQLMFDESDGPEWESRRDARVRRPVTDLGEVSAAGIPYLRPAVQLYYKAKSVREKDQLDFDAALPLLSSRERAWLASAVTMTLPGHPWLDRLAPTVTGTAQPGR
ncbi:nucleotidyltransferase domain-containing protein [Streptacidiphilus albus]|uniref:nucleotidyltransferase domain-containing protein n=1 Tax=Streptacidiphilus albus TaxID=105425 RepID=UPI00054C260B|nr:amino acid transporter [Streptacidiphilus albus]